MKHNGELFPIDLTLVERLDLVEQAIVEITKHVRVLRAAIQTGSIPDTASEAIQQSVHKPHPPRELLQHFSAKFGERFKDNHGRPMVAPISGAKDAAIMKRLHDRYGMEESCRLIDEFFASNEPFIVHSGYTVGVFWSQIGRLIAARTMPTFGATSNTARNRDTSVAAANLIRRAHGA